MSADISNLVEVFGAGSTTLVVICMFESKATEMIQDVVLSYRV